MHYWNRAVYRNPHNRLANFGRPKPECELTGVNIKNLFYTHFSLTSHLAFAMHWCGQYVLKNDKRREYNNRRFFPRHSSVAISSIFSTKLNHLNMRTKAEATARMQRCHTSSLASLISSWSYQIECTMVEGHGIHFLVCGASPHERVKPQKCNVPLFESVFSRLNLTQHQNDRFYSVLLFLCTLPFEAN